MCDCYKIGGPWIAENPNCHEHGTAAQERKERKSELRERVRSAQSIAELKDLLLEKKTIYESHFKKFQQLN